MEEPGFKAKNDALLARRSKVNRSALTNILDINGGGYGRLDRSAMSGTQMNATVIYDKTN